MIWDVAGQEKYHTIVPMYFKGAAVIAIVCSVFIRESFGSVRGWMDLSLSHAPLSTRVILVGHKDDLLQRRVLDCPEGERDASLFNAVDLRETSTLTVEGISDLLEMGAAPSVTDQSVEQSPSRQPSTVREVTLEDENQGFTMTHCFVVQTIIFSVADHLGDRPF
jgi:GTPase SAR1 family protein